MTCDGGLEVERKWTAAAHVGCGRPALLFNRRSRVIPAEPHRRKRVTPTGGSWGEPSVPRALAELAVEVDRGADQREVGEGLREVPEQLAGRPDLLRVEAQVVRVREHLLEHEPRLVEPSGAG